MEQEQAKFEGWAIVEVMGHHRYAGFVTTQAFGQAVLFRVDVPALDEREVTLRHSEYDREGRYIRAGSKVKKGAVQGYSKLIGAGSIYAITPCTQEAALAAVEEIQPRPLTLIDLPSDQKALPEPAPQDDENEGPDYDEDEAAERDEEEAEAEIRANELNSGLSDRA